jgi:hypothetical protein
MRIVRSLLQQLGLVAWKQPAQIREHVLEAQRPPTERAEVDDAVHL